MNKQILIAASLFLASGLSVQAGLTTVLGRIAANARNTRNTKAPQRRLCQTAPTRNNALSANDIADKSMKITQKHGVHLGYFLQHLPFSSFDSLPQMDKYLDLIDVYATNKMENIPSPDQFVAFSRQQQERKE